MGQWQEKQRRITPFKSGSEMWKPVGSATASRSPVSVTDRFLRALHFWVHNKINNAKSTVPLRLFFTKIKK